MNLERLERLEKTLADDIAAIKGRAEGRELSRAERKAIEAREQELAAIRDDIVDARDALTRREAFRMTSEAREELNAHLRALGGQAEPRQVASGAQSADSAAGVSEFRAFMRNLEERAFTTASSGAGAAVVPGSLVAPIAEKARAADPIAEIATWFDLRGGNSTMRLPYKAAHSDASVTGDFVSPRDTANTSATFGSKSLSALDYYAIQLAERHWLHSVPGSEDLMVRWCVEDLYEQFARDIAVGDGDDNAPGLFAADDFYLLHYTGASGSITAADFVAAYTKMPPRHRAQAQWILNSATLAAIFELDAANESATNSLLVTGSDGTMRILGRPVRECSNAPDLGASTIPVALIGPEAYACGTHFGPEVEVDTVTAVPMVKFNALARLGGSPWNPEAAVLIVAGAEPQGGGT